MDMLVDFSDIKQTNVNTTKIKNNNKYKYDYDKTTCLYYKAHRIKKTDPITFEELKDENSFKFPSIWDPYTGIRMEDDPWGPLYFNPVNILQYIYCSKLKGLWVNESDETGGFYEGYYGENVSTGEDLEIVGRGIYPEKHIFRLPVSNCYLKKNHSMSLITMGPLLTNKEICEIDRLLVKYWYHDKVFKKIYNRIGSLYKLKCYYEVAISKKPTLLDLSHIDLGKKKDIDEQSDPDLYLNKMAVEAIKRM